MTYNGPGAKRDAPERDLIGWKPDEPGHCLAGRITKRGANKYGEYIILRGSEVDDSGEFVQSGTFALRLNALLEGLVTGEDTGKVAVIEFVRWTDSEPHPSRYYEVTYAENASDERAMADFAMGKSAKAKSVPASPTAPLDMERDDDRLPF